jgi:catechol 2,3-dioxygenase-like lactoylglutathione lyase family enzyme
MKASDILYVRYQLADLDRAEAFLIDFGLTTVERDAHVLRMRGVAGQAPFMYEAVRGGDDRFVGFGFRAESLDGIDRLAHMPDSSQVEALEGTQGGWRVRMRMPDGFLVDAVTGFEPAANYPVRKPNAFNAGDLKQRINASVRQRTEPVPALRLGHVVLHVSDHDASVGWLNERLGLLPSDHLAPPDRPDHVIGTFMRIDKGSELVDHHCLFVLQSAQVGVHHCSFEVQDLDHVMAAHDHLLAKGYTLDCGVGRHMLGSQIYDYWRDPAGFRVEHYTDGDIVNHTHRPGVFCGTADETTQWGMRPSPDFFD